MAFADQFNKGMQRIMAMRTPEITALLPRVEAMTWEARVAMVTRGRDNLAAMLKGWDKFSPILAAQGHDRGEIKRRLKALRAAKNHLDDAMRLTDPRNPPAFRGQAQAAFDVLAACFLRDAGLLEAVLTGPRLTPSSVGSIVLPAFDSAVAASARVVDEPLAQVDADALAIEDVVVDGPEDARTEPEGEVVDVIAQRGGDRASV